MRILQRFFLPAVCSWFFMTVLVDFIAIPTVFRNISKISEAGKIGMTVFGRFNYFEIFFAVILLIISFSYKTQKRWNKFIIIVVPLFILSLLYTFKFTPAITYYGTEINQTMVTSPIYAELQSNLAFYHKLYRIMDSIKLLTLMFLAGLIVIQELKEEKV